MYLQCQYRADESDGALPFSQGFWLHANASVVTSGFAGGTRYSSFGSNPNTLTCQAVWRSGKSGFSISDP